ncbi:DMT family transporter [uncultured Rhodospira sp.]|uniref:DMT family transporter n=1 Tax=uncultured Rhodospira sp. TaxID=1936189 RepID=UPI002620F83E|nr:DMT family transporter [uncultured Rhodospira sp.]
MFTLRTVLAAGLTIVLWASAFPGIRAALQGYDPGHMVLLRFLVASAALGVFAAATRMALPRARDLPGMLGLGLLGIGVYQGALTFGQQTVEAGPAALIVSLSPMVMALLATAFLGERLRLWGWLGSGLGVVGVALIAVGDSGPDGVVDPGVALVFFAMVATAVYFVFQKPFLRRYSALQMTACGVWAGTAVMALLWAPGLVGAVRAAPIEATLAVVYMGVFPGMIAYLSWAYALSRAPASLVGSAMYLVPPVATLIAVVWPGEVPSPLTIAGGLIALAGVVIVQRWGRSRSPATG